MMNATTIFALSTPPGRAAIAIVRLSGPKAGDALDALTRKPRPEPRRAVLRKLLEPRSAILLDEALVIFFAAPRTETGEEMVELHLHGGRAVVRAVLDALGGIPQLRPAEPGEFIRRAFDNGKLDLPAIEGLADLIDAETESQRRQAIAQASGWQSQRFEAWRADVVRAMGLVEAAIDFSDEGDVGDRAVQSAEAQVSALTAALARELDDGRRGEILRDGFRVVLAGAPNAGKSSLLNALAQRDAAIVSDEAGTTRDIIEVRLDLAGAAVIVSDTAGIRDAASKVEQEGIRRTWQAAAAADLVVWLASDPTAMQPPALEGACLRVLSKADLYSDPMIHVKHGKDAAAPVFDHIVSAKTGDGIDELVADIAGRAKAAAGNPSDLALTRIRHRREITAALGHLRAFQDGAALGLELRAEDLRLAGQALGRLTGRIDAEDVLGEIFSRFCIGK